MADDAREDRRMARRARTAPEYEPRPRGARRGAPALLARFDEVARAREAMAALRNAGIDAADIGLVGKQVSRMARQARRRPPDRADRAITKWVATRSVADTLRTGALSAAAGVVVGAVLWAVTGSWILLPIAVVTVAAVATVVGVMVGFQGSTGLFDAWEMTFHDRPDGSAWVAVHAGNIGRAHDVLAEHGAAEFRRPADLDALSRLFEGIDTGRRPA